MDWQVLALYSGGELFWHQSFVETLQPSLLLVLIFARSKNSLHDDCIWYPIQIQQLLALRKKLLICCIPLPVSTLPNRSSFQRWIDCRRLSANCKLAAILDFTRYSLRAYNATLIGWFGPTVKCKHQQTHLLLNNHLLRRNRYRQYACHWLNLDGRNRVFEDL